MNTKHILLMAIVIITAIAFSRKHHTIDTIAIANYGPHASLENTILGIKASLEAEGFKANQNIHFEIMDVGFDPSLIPQMISALELKQPKVIISLTTPVAQTAKGMIQKTPIVYSVIADPVEAGLINEPYATSQNMTGTSDLQDMRTVVKFIRKILPNAKKVGLLYAISESNDLTLLKHMTDAVNHFGMELVAIPVTSSRDVPISTKAFKDRVDVIYVGTSGPIQPALPVIAAACDKMNIPIINADIQAVRDGLALASCGVDYFSIGKKTGQIAASILNGALASEIKPTYPGVNEHKILINKKLSIKHNINIPQDIDIVEV